jgi:C-lobe and N-lobe beta barrels of Tf-binding protein B
MIVTPVRCAVALAAVLATSSCGGGGEAPPAGSRPSSQPAQPTQPAGSTVNTGPNAPARSPNISAALYDPVQTALPVPPAAVDGGATLKNPAPNTIFPLLQVAVGPQFSGDASTTSQGATVNLDGATGRLGLTLNNESLQVIDVTVTADRLNAVGMTVYGVPIPDGRYLQTHRRALDHALYGYWLIFRFRDGGYFDALNGGAWLGGYVATGTVATTGMKTYSGSVDGIYDEEPGYPALLVGDVQVSVDFSTRVVTGTLTKLGLGSDNYIHGPLNDFAFSAILDQPGNTFTAPVRVTTPPGTSSAFSTDASGVISGRLFGPNANEVGAVWTLSDTSHRLVGSFAAAQTSGAN